MEDDRNVAMVSIVLKETRAENENGNRPRKEIRAMTLDNELSEQCRLQPATRKR
jgi:hypothetical protein